MMLVTDAHCHDEDGTLIALLRRRHIPAIINCGDAAEWRRSQARIGAEQRLSFGIHPWQSDQWEVQRLMAFYQAASVIGEIGLDSTWTKIPLTIQQPIFEQQLAVAQHLNKPVILHVKGSERQALTILKHYPNRYFVHWYSDLAYQEDYIAMGCYMSIGPDVWQDSAVAKLAKRVPDDRLLTESDGLGAIAWVLGRSVSVSDYLNQLLRALGGISRLRGQDPWIVARLIRSNLNQFLSAP